MGNKLLIPVLEKRFKQNMHRHQDVEWVTIEESLLNNDNLLEVINNMENTGGEPDLVLLNGLPYYVDFSKETPIERRSICYDLEALNNRKTNKPRSDATTIASNIGIELLNVEEYITIQDLEDLDLKTSSWLLTDDSFRKLGGAKFGEKRYKETFVFHNGADSYYSSRGFRGKVIVK